MMNSSNKMLKELQIKIWICIKFFSNSFDMWSFINLTDLDINLPLDCKNIIWYLHTKIIMCKVVQPSILLFIFVQWIIPRIYTKIEKKYNPKIPLIKGIKRYAKRISFYICLRYEHKFVKWTGFIIAVNYAIFFDVKL